MSADSGSEMLDYTDSEEERKREEQRAIEEKKRVDKCIFFRKTTRTYLSLVLILKTEGYRVKNLKVFINFQV